MEPKDSPDGNGYYWFDGVLGWHHPANNLSCRGIVALDGEDVHVPECASYYRLADSRGKWYGPLVPPWPTK